MSEDAKRDARLDMIDRLTRRLWRAEERLAEAESAIRFAEEEIDSMRRSRSWRLTAPLRVMAPRLRRAANVGRRASKAVWWTLTLQLGSRLRERQEALAAAAAERQKAEEETYARWIEMHDTLHEADMAGMRALFRDLPKRPLVSVLMPVFDPPVRILREAIESVQAQVYENWELCIADDASTQPGVGALLEEFAHSDSRVRLVRRRKRGGISAASNSAFGLAKGDLIALLDHDDLLRPHSLLLAVAAFVRRPSVGYLYTDADRIDEFGRPLGHFFKPDWSPTLLLSQNYLCHMAMMRADLVREVGGFRSEYDGSQDWDLALRVTERLTADDVVHVPHVLYHWRAIRGSVAADGSDAKPYAAGAARRAAEAHLRRKGRLGYATPVRSDQIVHFQVESPQPRVSIIIPSTGRKDLLEPCVERLLSRTDYSNFEIVIVLDPRVSADHARSTGSFLGSLEQDPRIRLLSGPPQPFNFAATVNLAATQTASPFLLLLNDDTEVVYDDWCELMVGQALDDRVGAVGGLLVHPDGTIQSAGMLLGPRGLAEHRYHRRPGNVFGYANRAKVPQDMSVVAATCMLIRRDAFEDVGGFDESFPVAYNDVDFCLKLRQRGWRVVYAPDVLVVHHDSASFGTYRDGREEEHRHDFDRMHERWGLALQDDPMHNPNLALDASYPDRLAFPPRVDYPWRAKRR